MLNHGSFFVIFVVYESEIIGEGYGHIRPQQYCRKVPQLSARSSIHISYRGGERRIRHSLESLCLLGPAACAADLRNGDHLVPLRVKRGRGFQYGLQQRIETCRWSIPCVRRPGLLVHKADILCDGICHSSRIHSLRGNYRRSGCFPGDNVRETAPTAQAVEIYGAEDDVHFPQRAADFVRIPCDA